MNWVRTRLRLGSCIALLALAFQFAVSFGHVHLDALVDGSSSMVTAAVGAAPAGDHRSDVADHYCPICALIHLAETMAPAQPPIMPMPVMFVRLRPDATVKFGFTSPPPSFFPARAPPVA